MRSLLLAIMAGLVGAALLHVIIILTLPASSVNDAWSKVAGLGEAGQFYRLANEENTTGLANKDPHIRTAVCRFDLSDGPVRISANGNVPLWTIGVFDKGSNETYSMNDRTAIGNSVDLTLVTPVQMLRLRRDMPPAIARSVLVELSDPEGFIVLRAIVPGKSMERIVRKFLEGASCARLAVG